MYERHHVQTFLSLLFTGYSGKKNHYTNYPTHATSNPFFEGGKVTVLKDTTTEFTGRENHLTDQGLSVKIGTYNTQISAVITVAVWGTVHKSQAGSIPTVALSV